MNYYPEPKYFNVVYQPIIGISCSLVNTLLDCQNQIIIGDYVSFGHDCKLLTGYHDMTVKGKDRQDLIKSKPIVIKNGVWIASGVIVCAGVTIGENSVIGAGSVVNRDVPDNQFWAGVPARFIKSL